MTTHKLLVLGERDITFDDACAHPARSTIGFRSVFRKLHRSTTVPNRKGCALKRCILTRLELGLEGAFWHAIDQVIGTRSHFDFSGKGNT